MKTEFVIIQIIGVLIESIITYQFFESTISQNKSNRKFGNKTILFYVGFFVVLSVVNCSVRNMLITPVCMYILILLISQIYNRSFRVKILLSTLLLIIFVLSELATGMIIAIVSEKSMEIISDNPMLYFQGMFVSQMVSFIIVKIIGLSKRQFKYLPIKVWLQIMIIPFTSMISVYAVVEVAYKMNNLRSSMYVILIAVCLVVANLFTFHLFEKELQNRDDKLRYSFLERQLEDEKEYYKMLHENQIQIQKTSHDMKNTLISILGNISEGKTESAIKKINEMLDNTNQSSQTVYTGQVTVDTMINIKKKCMDINDICFKPICFMSKECNFDEIGFCIVLGNALDNAIEACKKVDKENRYILLKIIEDESLLSCYLENSSNGIMPKENEKTTKMNKSIHGFGLDNMKMIINNNGGAINASCNENKFVLLFSFVKNNKNAF